MTTRVYRGIRCAVDAASVSMKRAGGGEGRGREGGRQRRCAEGGVSWG